MDGGESHRTGHEPHIHFRRSLWDVHAYIGAQTPPRPVATPAEEGGRGRARGFLLTGVKRLRRP